MLARPADVEPAQVPDTEPLPFWAVSAIELGPENPQWTPVNVAWTLPTTAAPMAVPLNDTVVWNVGVVVRPGAMVPPPVTTAMVALAAPAPGAMAPTRPRLAADATR